MWIQLKALKHIEVQGKLRTYHIGDWVNVGKQAARMWISQGDAHIPQGQATRILDESCGVYIWGNYASGEKALGDYAGSLEMIAGDTPDVRWNKTLIYNPRQRLRKELLPIGFHLLDTWEMAIPLWDYKELACHVGTQEEQENTRSAIRDLRVPLYSPDLVFARKCPNVEKVIRQWQDGGGDTRLSLLRAIYAVKPFILALPTTWLWKDMGSLNAR